MSSQAVSRGMGGHWQAVDLLSVDEDELTLERLKRASKILASTRRSLYERGSRIPRCARVRQFFRYDEVERFFGLVSSDSDRVAFALMLAFGLRVSEVSRCSFHEPSMQLRVYSSKTDRYETLPVYPSALRIARHADMVRASSNGLRNRFRKALELDPSLSYSYALSDDERSLRQFSSKTLRKTAVQFVYEATRDPMLTALFSRHSLPNRYGQLASYLYFDELVLRGALEESLGPVLECVVLPSENVRQECDSDETRCEYE